MDLYPASLRIRDLNDLLRKFPFPPFGEMLITSSIAAMPAAERLQVLRKVNQFTAFSVDNDPYGEHDFGAFDHNGVRYFWKIDYYDLQKQYRSPDAADPAVTCRVLTIMQACEY